MEKSFLSIENPERSRIFLRNHSRVDRSSQSKKLLKSFTQCDRNGQKSKFSLPGIHFHIPSYEIVHSAKINKQKSVLSTPKLPDKRLIDFTMKNLMTKNEKYDAICKLQTNMQLQKQIFLTLETRDVLIQKSAKSLQIQGSQKSIKILYLRQIKEIRALKSSSSLKNIYLKDKNQNSLKKILLLQAKKFRAQLKNFDADQKSFIKPLRQSSMITPSIKVRSCKISISSCLNRFFFNCNNWQNQHQIDQLFMRQISK